MYKKGAMKMRLRMNSISVQVFTLFLVCSILLIVALSAIFYKRTTDQINQRFSEILYKSVSQASDNIGLITKSYDSLSKSIVTNPDIQRLLSLEENNVAIRKINERTITNLLGTIYFSRDDVAGIHIIMNDGAIYSYGSYMVGIDMSYVHSPWYEDLAQSTGEMVWIGVQKHSLIDLIQTNSVFSFGRSLFDIYNSRPIGVVLIETKPNAILNTLNNLRMGSNGQSYILSENNTILAQSAESTPTSIPITELTPFQEEDSVVLIDKSDEMMGVGNPSKLNWRIVNVTSKSDLRLEVNETKRFLAIVLGIALLIAIALATFFSRSITAPIKKMVREMKQVERGNFNIAMQVKSFDEINFLVSAFNRMVSRMNLLVDRVRFVSISEKNAQLYALQSQVNPHFLYNTLDMIYWMLDEKENEPLSNIILSLSKMFRYSSDWEHSEVTLREEMEQISHYLKILQVRMDGRLQVTIDIADPWLDIRLPKMTLQPIIENAIIHGLAKQKKQGQLTLYVDTDGNILNIHIQDNGVGISKDRLIGFQQALVQIARLEVEELEDHHDNHLNIYKDALAQAKPLDTGVGLINVHRRLVLKFGAQYGLSLSSVLEKGTTVSILLPIQMKL